MLRQEIWILDRLLPMEKRKAYTEQGLSIREAARLGIRNFLSKPFTASELLQILKPEMAHAKK